MDFALFILVNAALFIRPGEVVPALTGAPVYLVLILICLAVSLPKLISDWTSHSLSERPATLCVLGVLVAVIFSHLRHLDIASAINWGSDFSRVVLYYLLVVSVINTPSKLKTFLVSMLAIIVTMAILSICQYHGYIDIPALQVLERREEDPSGGEMITIIQLVGTGIFNDPNDYCMIMNVGLFISLYMAGDRRLGPLRILGLGICGFLGYAIILTQSRGGFLGLVAGLMTLLAIRIGTRRALLLSAIGLPVALAVLGGRFAKMSASSDTALERLHLWGECFVEIRTSPLFGIGTNTLQERIGLVAHNSYLQAFTEMGLWGGTWFLGLWYFGIKLLVAKDSSGDPADEPVENAELRRSSPFLLAILVSIMAGMFSITRCFTTTIYLPVGLAEVYHRLAINRPGAFRVTMSARNFANLLILDVLCLGGISMFVRIFGS